MSAAAIVFVVCAAACVVAHVAILVSVVRSRAATPPADVVIPRPNLVVEVVWALVPVIALALVLTATWSRIRDRPASPPVIMRIAN